MTTEADLMKEAGTPVVYSNVYYGKCLLTLWEGKFPRNEEGKVCGRPIHWNDGDDPKERMVMIEMTLDLCPGCTSNYPIRISVPKHDKDWQKIILPSLLEAGASDNSGAIDLSKVKDHFVKIQQVEGTRQRDRNDPDKGCWNTYKFLAIYKDQDECLAAMAADGEGEPQPAAKPAASADDSKRQAALEFCKVAIAMCKGMTFAEAKAKTAEFIAGQQNVSPFVSVDDKEIRDMIVAVTGDDIPF